LTDSSEIKTEIVVPKILFIGEKAKIRCKIVNNSNRTLFLEALRNIIPDSCSPLECNKIIVGRDVILKSELKPFEYFEVELKIICNEKETITLHPCLEYRIDEKVFREYIGTYTIVVLEKPVLRIFSTMREETPNYYTTKIGSVSTILIELENPNDVPLKIMNIAGIRPLHTRITSPLISKEGSIKLEKIVNPLESILMKINFIAKESGYEEWKLKVLIEINNHRVLIDGPPIYIKILRHEKGEYLRKIMQPSLAIFPPNRTKKQITCILGIYGTDKYKALNLHKSLAEKSMMSSQIIDLSITTFSEFLSNIGLTNFSEKEIESLINELNNLLLSGSRRDTESLIALSSIEIKIPLIKKIHRALNKYSLVTLLNFNPHNRDALVITCILLLLVSKFPHLNLIISSSIEYKKTIHRLFRALNVEKKVSVTKVGSLDYKQIREIFEAEEITFKEEELKKAFETCGGFPELILKYITSEFKSELIFSKLEKLRDYYQILLYLYSILSRSKKINAKEVHMSFLEKIIDLLEDFGLAIFVEDENSLYLVAPDIVRQYLVDSSIPIESKEFFANRTYEIDMLINYMKEKKRKTIAYIYGLPGYGKTTLARRVLKDVAKEQFILVIWIDIKSRLNYIDLLQTLIFEAFRMHLISHDQYLLIQSASVESKVRFLSSLINFSFITIVLDNVHNLDKSAYELLLDLIEQSPNTRWILISRTLNCYNYLIDSGIPIVLIHVRELPIEDFYKYVTNFHALKKLLNSGTKILEIYKVTKGSPQSVKLLNNYVEKIRLFSSDILKYFETQIKKEMKSFLLALLGKIQNIETELIKLLIMSSDPLPFNVIVEYMNLSGKSIDRSRIIDALMNLNKIGILQIDGCERYRIHPQVQEILQDEFSSCEKEIFKKLARAFYKARIFEHSLIYATRAKDYAFLLAVYEDISKYLKRRHLIDLIVNVGKTLIQNTATPDVLKAFCYKDLGYVKVRLGYLNEALEYYCRAKGILEKANNLHALIEVYRYIGDIYHMYDDYDRGLIFSKKAVEIAEKLVPETEDHIYALSQYAHILLHKSAIKAENVFKQLYHLVKKNPHFDTRIIADTIFMYGDCLVVLQKFDQAIKILEEALKIAEEGDDRLIMARAYIRLADAHNGRFSPEIALEYLSNANKILSKIKDRSIAYMKHSYGETYKLMNHLDKALKYYKEGLELSTKIKNKNRIAHSHLGLADINRLLKNKAEAKKHYEIAEKMYNDIKSEWGLINTKLSMYLMIRSQTILNDLKKLLSTASYTTYELERRILREKKEIYPFIFP